MNPHRNISISILIIIFTLTVIAGIGSYILAHKDMTPEESSADTYELALLTSQSGEASSAIEKQCRHAVKESAKSLNKSSKNYLVKNQDTGSYEAAIQEAVTSKARLIVCPDSSYTETVYKVQGNYLHTYFLLINSSHHNTSLNDSSIPYNMIPIQFDESEMGFLAGYSLVYDGHTALTLIGSDEDSCSTHYEYGFLQGADTAAVDLGIKDVTVTCYHAASEEDADAFARKFYETGQLLTSTCDAYAEVLHTAAKESNRKLVVCGNTYTELEDESLAAVTVKNVEYAISDVIDDFYEGIVNGGKANLYSAANHGISYVFDGGYFKAFTRYTLDAVYQRLAKDEIPIISDTTVTTSELGLKRIKLQ